MPTRFDSRRRVESGERHDVGGHPDVRVLRMETQLDKDLQVVAVFRQRGQCVALPEQPVTKSRPFLDRKLYSTKGRHQVDVVERRPADLKTIRLMEPAACGLVA